MSTSAGTTYAPSTVTATSSGRSDAYVYDGNSSSATYGDPLMVLAPNANISASTATTTACPNPASASTWTAGCRGLTFTYDSATHNVATINFVAYDGTTLTNTAVAQYAYNSNGKLKHEWDPRISPGLKTAYQYVTSSGNPDYGRIFSVTPPESQSTPLALEPWTLAYDDTSTDPNYGKLLTVTRTHSSTYGGASATQTVHYNVPMTAATGGPIDMDANTVATWGQSDTPISAAAVFPADHVPASTPTASDYTYAAIHYYDAQGHEVNTATNNGTWNVATTEYDANGNVIRTLSAANRATALAAGANSVGISQQLDSQSLYSADGTELLDTYGPAHLASTAGVVQTIRTHSHSAYDAGAPNGDVAANRQPYRLVTSRAESASLGANVPGTSDTDTRTTQFVYNIGTDNTGWTLRTPLQTVTDPSGLAITKTACSTRMPRCMVVRR